jgi:hypothetical protein
MPLLEPCLHPVKIKTARAGTQCDICLTCQEVFDLEEPGPVARVWRAFRCEWDPTSGEWQFIGGIGHVWDSAEQHAECRNGFGHEAPDEQCGCGIYGWYEPKPVFDQYLDHWMSDTRIQMPALAHCLYWGKTVIGTQGVRTEYVRVEKLYVIQPDHISFQLDITGIKGWEDVNIQYVRPPELLTILQG